MNPFTCFKCGLTFPKKCCVDTARASKPQAAFCSSPRAQLSSRACRSHLSFSRCTSCLSASRACRSGLLANPFRGAVVLCFGYPREAHKANESLVNKNSTQGTGGEPMLATGPDPGQLSANRRPWEEVVTVQVVGSLSPMWKIWMDSWLLAVAGIWGVSQQMRDLPICLFLSNQLEDKSSVTTASNTSKREGAAHAWPF